MRKQNTLTSRNLPISLLNQKSDQSGFTTAQFVMLVGFTLLILTTFVNILIVENTRQTTLTSLREAARAGTRRYDLRRIESRPADIETVEADCRNKFISTMNDISPALDPNSVVCSVIHDDSGGNDRYYMRAEIDSVGGVKLVPWAQIFSARTQNLSATYTPTEAAR